MIDVAKTLIEGGCDSVRRVIHENAHCSECGDDGSKVIYYGMVDNMIKKEILQCHRCGKILKDENKK